MTSSSAPLEERGFRLTKDNDTIVVQPHQQLTPEIQIRGCFFCGCVPHCAHRPARLVLPAAGDVHLDASLGMLTAALAQPEPTGGVPLARTARPLRRRPELATVAARFGVEPVQRRTLPAAPTLTERLRGFADKHEQ